MSKKDVRTLADISKIADVSPATISRVINNSGYVSQKTRQKVETIIKAHGFFPNKAARTLTKAKTLLVGLIIPNFDNPVYLEVLKGVNSAAIEKGYSVVLSESGENPENIKESMMHLASLQVDGIIVTQPEVHDLDITEYLTTFIRERIPIARLGNSNAVWQIDGVYADSFESGYLAGLHLAQLGYENIGILGMTVNQHVQKRMEGVRTSLVEKGISMKMVRQYDSDFTQAGGYRTAMELIESSKLPDAIIALNDVMALGVLMAAEERGIDVPRRLAVVGVDGIPEGLLVRPRLSTVILPTFEMGKQLFEMIFSRISGKYNGEAREQVFHSRMAPRESTIVSQHRKEFHS